MTRTLTLGLLLALLAAAALRFPQLDTRPMHNDEGVNAIKLRALWEHGSYQYDPNEYHGPTLPYITWAWMKLAGAKNFVDFSEAQLRAVTVLFGLGLILLLPLVVDGLGRRAMICAAFFTAISPAMVFYSRYYIHEMLLVFFTFLTLASGWRYVRSSKLGWALLCGASVGLMQATKETFVFAVAAMVVALVMSRIGGGSLSDSTRLDLKKKELAGARAVSASTGRDDGARSEAADAQTDVQSAASRDGSRSAELSFDYLHLTAALVVWLAVVLLLFSSFFTNAKGPLDAVRTYLPWLHRARGASPHIHPWNFYFERLLWFHPRRGPVWSEALIFALALIGIVVAFVRNGVAEGSRRFIRFIAFYTLVLTMAYCVIGYKTPWCLLNFWQGMILLAGVGTVALLHWLRKRPLQIAAGLLLLAASAQLIVQAWRASVDYAADQRNPYVYAQTSPDVDNLIARVKAMAAVSSQKNRMVIKVMAPENDYGPLPWYFRNFERIGWYSDMPSDPYASVMIVSRKFNAALDQDNSHLNVGLFELRPQNWFDIYVETNLWNAYLQTRMSKSSPTPAAADGAGTGAGK